MDRNRKCLWCFFEAKTEQHCGKCAMIYHSQFCSTHHANDYLEYLKLQQRPDRGIING